MRRRTYLLAALLLVSLAAIAGAAEPESGAISKASPKVTWTGSVTGFASWQLYNQGQNECVPPTCDTFALEVSDGPATLSIKVASADSPSYVEVVKPDGSSQLFGSGETVKATIKDAASGSYTINVAQNEQTQGAHEGSAELVFPAEAEPEAPPAPAPTAAPPPTLEVTTRTAKRGRSIAIRLQSSGTLTNVKAVLLKGKRKVASGRLRQLGGASKITLKAKRALKRGRYTARVSGVDEQGRTVTAAAKLRLR